MMAIRDSSGSLEVAVTDFGPIARANIELRPLTVFVGPTNTGKSYLAMLIYAMHRAISGAEHSKARKYDLLSSRFGLPTWDNINYNIPSDFSIDIEMWVNQSFGDSITQQNATLKGKPIPTSFASMMDALVWGSDEVHELFENEISRCFGVEAVSNLIRRRSSKESRIEIRTRASEDAEMLRINLDIAETRLTVRAKTSATTPIDFSNKVRANRHVSKCLSRINESICQARDDSHMLPSNREIQSQIARTFWIASELVVPRLLGELFRNAHLLPASRTGIIHSTVWLSLPCSRQRQQQGCGQRRVCRSSLGYSRIFSKP